MTRAGLSPGSGLSAAPVVGLRMQGHVPRTWPDRIFLPSALRHCKRKQRRAEEVVHMAGRSPGLSTDKKALSPIGEESRRHVGDRGGVQTPCLGPK